MDILKYHRDHLMSINQNLLIFSWSTAKWPDCRYPAELKFTDDYYYNQKAFLAGSDPNAWILRFKMYALFKIHHVPTFLFS